MQSHSIAILLAAVAIGSSTANPNLVSGPSKMLEILSATSDVQRNNPDLTASCFAYYQGVFAEEYAAYQTEYNQCEDEFAAGKSGVLEKYNSNVWELSNSTYASCKALINCDAQENSLESLNCYSSQGTENSKEVYSIASNASITAGTLIQEISSLNFTRNICTSESSRKYEISSAQTYTDFQSCLAGKLPVPDPATTTTPSQPITTTTSQPITTTPSQPITTTTSQPITTTTSQPTTTTTSQPITTTTSQPITTTTGQPTTTTTKVPNTDQPSTLSPFSHGGSSSAERKQWMNKLENILKQLL